MPFPNAHLRVTWFGDGWASQEEWSTGLRINGIAMPSAAQLDSLDAAFAALFSNPNIVTTRAVRYLGVKVAPQDVNGLYGASGVAKEKLRATPLATTNAGGLPQATMVATLTTATPRGLANEGRMYLPATTLVPADDGRIVAGIAESYRDAVVTFINAVDAVGLGPVSVFSKGTPKTPGGAVRDVTGVRLGRVVDTQRRRRNRIPEMYVSAATGPS
jgi:hypothetical protein